MKPNYILILLGIFLISLVSAVPTISEIAIEPEQPIVSEEVKICANMTDDISEITTARINLHSEDPVWNWGLIMDEEGDLYCRALSPQLMDAYGGKEISYYLSARNSLGELTTSPTYYFTYVESVITPEPEEEDDDEDSSSTSEINFPCEPSWKCGAWSVCGGGIMQRDCYDRNDCSNSYNKPNEVVGCEVNEQALVESHEGFFLYFNIFLTFALLVVLVGIAVKR
jgi:hypothetical protein